MDVTKPYKCIGFGAMDVTKPSKFIGLGELSKDSTRPRRAGITRASGATLQISLTIFARPGALETPNGVPETPGICSWDVTKPYKFIGFGAMDATKPYKFIRFGPWLSPNPINV